VGVMSREETADVSCMTVTPSCSKGALGAWQFQGGPRTRSRGKAAGKEGTTLWVNHRWRGVCMSVLELRRAAGKTHEGKPRSEPDRVKPAVRDRRGACGNVATMGAGLRPVGKPTELPPDPTGASAPHFYPDKRTHWMWFIFPQIKGLGLSAMAQHYGIESIDEARAYWQHPILGRRLTECTDLLLRTSAKSAHDIFGAPDDLKLRSCMTLFAETTDAEPVFKQVLDRFFDGRPDARTLALLRQ